MRPHPAMTAWRTSPAVRARRYGLTLVELLIALALLALLGTLALPGFGARLDRERVVTAAETLAADINEARFEAARQGRPLHLLVQPGPAWCWAVATDAACPCGSADPCSLRHARGGDHPGIAMPVGAPLVLQADGRPQALASSPVELEGRHGLRLRVTVSAMGRAHVCSVRGSSSRHPSCSG